MEPTTQVPTVAPAKNKLTGWLLVWTIFTGFLTAWMLTYAILAIVRLAGGDNVGASIAVLILSIVGAGAAATTGVFLLMQKKLARLISYIGLGLVGAIEIVCFILTVNFRFGGSSSSYCAQYSEYGYGCLDYEYSYSAGAGTIFWTIFNILFLVVTLAGVIGGIIHLILSKKAKALFVK